MLQINLFTAQLDKRNVKDAVSQILSIDNDFTENEEYFREDTLDLGFQNEAERVAEEISKEHSIVDDELITKILEINTGECQFIIGNTNYTDSYLYELTDLGDDKLFLSVAYGSR
jgi:hypothetical protein